MKKTLALMIAAALGAGSAQANDLLTVYREAVAHDAQFAAARASQAAGKEKEAQGLAAVLPTIGLTAYANQNNVEFKSRAAGAATASRNYDSNGWTVQLSQPLFRWQNFMQYRQGELAAAQAGVQFGVAKQDLIVRVAQAYFDLLLAQEAVTTAAAQKTAIAEQLESAKRNFEVGTATITDTHEAQARFDLATAQELAAENDLLVKRQALRAVAGKEYADLKSLRAGVKLASPQPADINKWVESAEQGALAVQLGQLGLEIADKEVEKQRAGHYPTLDLVASHSRSGQGGSIALGVAAPGSDSGSNVVGVQLAIPIFAGGAVSSRDREAVALREKALADLENARRQSALAARQAYLGVASGLAQVGAYEAALVSSKSALESNKLGYEVGVRINIDVLNAQTQVFDTKQKLAAARLTTLANLLKLKSTAATLSEEDLAAINALLE
ncbi:MAG: TolC family outer membrane protein [Gammaproteobacteria bacterium]|nr:TolC family outer membrane protein [Gammaproteobacteria bacterium]MBU1647604.1 TolC family outer membrane protein [Gammaproteobacteria bacterium]MBU1971493.1 TolC family outer membrane protein [Gammaproteobacteria bacterium]